MSPRVDELPYEEVVTAPPAAGRPPPCSLAEVHTAFRKHLGRSYDLGALDAVLATAAAARLPGDPCWLLLVGGPGAAKTETVVALSEAGALITSSIASEGALLSGTARAEKAKDATGGLLRRLGARGLLVIKDVTSILAMNTDTRAGLLAAFREIHDGRWERNVGTDGGRSLLWEGRVVVIGAVTTAWDKARDVISTMGDRFVLVRLDSYVGRLEASQRARRNVGEEVAMRAELARVVAGLLSTVPPDHTLVLRADEERRLTEAANLVTLARTGVDYDFRGDVIDAHAPEMPTRFVKQLYQLMRGATALGMPRGAALRLALRCARDSMPPLRLALLDDVAAYPDAATLDVRTRLNKPRTTVDRQLQALQLLRVLTCREEETEYRGKPITVCHYSLAPGIDPATLIVRKNRRSASGSNKGGEARNGNTPPDLSGHYPDWVTAAEGDPEP